MTNDEMVKQLDIAIDATISVRNALAGPPANTIKVPLGASLQAAIDSAPANSTLQLEDGTYPGAIRLTKALQFIGANPPAAGRATHDTAHSWITSSDTDTITVTNTTDPVKFTGIGFRNSNASGGLVNHLGSHLVLDRCVGLGDPTNGQRRGMIMNGSDWSVLGNYWDDIILSSKETVVLGGWDGTRDGLIDDCYLRGGSITVMFGGADSKSADRIPTNITIRNSTLTKNPAWFAAGRQIKNAFELKSAINVTMRGCILEYAGLAEGQGAYCLLFTVRNQDGTAPWSCVKNVLIENCTGRYCAGAISFLGFDDNHQSDILDNVTIRNCTFTDITRDGPWTYTDASGAVHTGSGRVTLFNNAPAHVTLEALTFAPGPNANLQALGYFPPANHTPKLEPVALTLRNWKYPPTTYGWKIDAGPLDTPPSSTHLQAYMPDLTYAITATDPGSSL